MSLLSHNELITLLNQGIIENSKEEHVNAASIDLTLGRYILKEDRKIPDYGDPYEPQRVSLAKREGLLMSKIDLASCLDYEYVLKPGEFILAQTQEVFNLPNWLSAEYKLKSSLARIGLDHLNAGWADAGWHGSVLTLEFRNLTTYHEIAIRMGDKIGQMIFFSHTAVPDEASYAARGSYNKNKEVTGAKNGT